MKRTLTLAVVAGTLACTQIAQADTDVQTKKAIALLYAYEVPDPTVWAALPESIIHMLIRAYDSKNSPKHVRLRAVAAAAFSPSKTSRAFLRRVAADTKLPSIYTRRAVVAMSRAFGETAIDDIKVHLGSKRADVREVAVASLAQLKSKKARALVDAHLRTERNERVRRAATQEVR